MTNFLYILVDQEIYPLPLEKNVIDPLKRPVYNLS